MLEFLAALDFGAGFIVGAVVIAVVASIITAFRQTHVAQDRFNHGLHVFPKERPKADSFANRVCAVACVGVLSFAAAHATFAPIKTVTTHQTTVINRNEAVPDGTITRADCVRLKGRTFQQVIYDYGLPQEFDRTDAFFDSLHYSLGEKAAYGSGNNSKECNIYFETSDHGLTSRVNRVSIDV